MAEQVTFGRRQPTPARSPAPVVQAAAASRADPGELRLTPAAEAFRASLKGGAPRSEFQAWSGAQSRRLTAIWALRVGLMVPGLLGFAIHLPLLVSLGLEAAGVVANGWLQRGRRKHLSAVRAWQATDGAEVL